MTALGVKAVAKSGRGGAKASVAETVTGTVAAEPIIDEAHLEQMTLGDRGLEREVLQIFVRQAAIMMGRIAGAEPALVAAAAHTLTGSARGIGAWRVAHAAERLERASSTGRNALSEAIAELKAASHEASAAIGARLANPGR
jgi:HPt (histidine-containing phosphotransfer) domain-containing protein